jgi:hypothetical protein
VTGFVTRSLALAAIPVLLVALRFFSAEEVARLRAVLPRRR